MNETNIFLEAIKKANGDNTILKKLTVEGVAFIDYKKLNNKVVDGIKVNSCIRLKTLPKSGFVGSRKIYYNKINLNDLYPFIQDRLILVSENSDIKDLISELETQAGIILNTSILIIDLNKKLIFDDQQCGQIVIEANPKSLYIDGKLTIRYTSYKYRVLNYVKNRVIALSETSTKYGRGCTVIGSYYNDLSNFPPDHELYEKYNMFVHPNYYQTYFQNEILYEDINGNMVPEPVKDFAFRNLPEFFDSLRARTSFFEHQKEFWDNYQKYNVQRVVQGYLKYITSDEWHLHSEEPNTEYSGNVFVDRNQLATNDFELYYIGTTIGLVNKIKKDPDYQPTVAAGNCGVNINFKYCYALRWRSDSHSTPDRKGLFFDQKTILPLYWDLND